MDYQVNQHKAERQLPKLKSLLNKYRQIRSMQSGLLRLSELAATLTDIDSFYQELDSVITSLLVTDSFHIILLDEQKNLKLAHSHNTKEHRLLEHMQQGDWQFTLTSKVFESGIPQQFNKKERTQLMRQGEIKVYGSDCVDWLGVPLTRGAKVIGVISLQTYDENHAFDTKDCQLLEFIAEHLVTAIDRVHSRELLEVEIQERTLELTQTNSRLQSEIEERHKAEKIYQMLLEVSEITATTDDLDSFYQSIHQAIQKILPAENLYIIQQDQMGKMHCPYFVDQVIDEMPSRFANKGLSERTIYQAAPILIKGDEQLILSADGSIVRSEFKDHLIVNKMPKAWLSAPLFEKDQVFGMLAIQSYEDQSAYCEQDLILIQYIAQHLSIAIVRKRNQLQEQRSKDALEMMVKERTQALEMTNLRLRMQIDERKKAEDQLYHDAHHDTLTGLPNRAMFSSRLSYALNHVKRHSRHNFAVLFIDLDRFKMINDTLGHHAGDQFLIEISKRLSLCIRENDLLARLGGDEFVILLDAFNTQEDIEEIATRIINRISQPFEIDGNELYSNASIGITVFNRQYNDAAEILRDADAAMYQAKNLGRGRFVFFDDSMRQKLIASLTLEQELRAGIKNKEFELHYQKISDLEKANTIGFEALLRWRHPEKGLLTPSEFLLLAEETGMILQIESWVIEQVSRQLALWQDDEQYKSAYIGINLSGRHLTQPNQLKKLMKTIKSHTEEPERLILEFNESAFSQHTDIALKGLKKLKEFGVKLALDDYGSGLSSLNFLHNYPFEFIKLDRSFVKSLSSKEKNLSVVKALNQLGEQFGYRVVAEGIESEEMLKTLKNAGCEFGQGYHINRPKKLLNIIDAKPEIA